MRKRDDHDDLVRRRLQPRAVAAGDVGRGRAPHAAGRHHASPRWVSSPGRASSRGQGEYDFAWLDEVLDLLHAGGIRVDLATATASPPPWLARLHPETLPVTEDGVRLAVGSRQQYCPSSPVYREHAPASSSSAWSSGMRDHPALELWHVNNEYGCHVSHCYCEVSAAAFRSWLEAQVRVRRRAQPGVGDGVLVAALRLVRRDRAAARGADASATRPSCSTSTGSRATSCSPATGRRSRSSARGIRRADHDELHGLLQAGRLLEVGAARRHRLATTPTPTPPTRRRRPTRPWCAT